MKRKRDSVRVWRIHKHSVVLISRMAEAGDRVSGAGSGLQFRELRRALASRGLPLGRIGCGLYVVPAAAVRDLIRIEQTAHALEARDDASAGCALLDLLAEHDLGHAQGEIRRSCRVLPKRRRLPGGQLWDAGGEPTRPARRSVCGEEKGPAKLSRLQKALLAYSEAHGDLAGGAPLQHFGRVEGPRGRAASAALSRSLHRLEERGLVRVVQSAGGRATHVVLAHRPNG